jgi:hypothetical protein
MTFEFVALEPQGLQIRKVPQGFRDAPCIKLNEKSGGQSGPTTSKNAKTDLKVRCRSAIDTADSATSQGNLGYFLREGVKISVRFRWSVGE